MTRRLSPRRRFATAGFTLIEMMVALAIGLAVVGAVVAVPCPWKSIAKRWRGASLGRARNRP